jgi:DNA-binding NtrC family response regulator
MLSRVLEKDGYEVYSETGTNNIMEKIRSSSPDVVFLDIDLPEKSGMDILREIMNEKINTQVIMLTADDTAETAVRAMKLGAVDYLTKPFNTDEVKIVLNNILEKESLRQEVTYLRKVYSESLEKTLLGESGAIKELKEKMEKMARARVSTVLVTGESGTGKEIISRNIHHLIYGTGNSKYSPFISINCAAMPESILESELFGYEKGSFTDAKSSKKGLFEMADGGSILLDEIGDTRMDLQS